MSWSPADDYDDHGQHQPGPTPQRRRMWCDGCHCVAARACETHRLEHTLKEPRND